VALVCGGEYQLSVNETEWRLMRHG
jgi:hypothetical protein